MSKNNFFRFLIETALATLLAVVSVPASAQAQSDNPSRGSWLAASSNEASLTGRSWGRLTLADGVLAFHATNYDWRLELSEITRISSSKAVSNAFEVESASGQLYYVGILNGQLLMTSPGRAVRTIQRAVRTAPMPAAARSTVVAARGGGPR